MKKAKKAKKITGKMVKNIKKIKVIRSDTKEDLAKLNENIKNNASSNILDAMLKNYDPKYKEPMQSETECQIDLVEKLQKFFTPMDNSVFIPRSFNKKRPTKKQITAIDKRLKRERSEYKLGRVVDFNPPQTIKNLVAEESKTVLRDIHTLISNETLVKLLELITNSRVQSINHKDWDKTLDRLNLRSFEKQYILEENNRFQNEPDSIELIRLYVREYLTKAVSAYCSKIIEDFWRQREIDKENQKRKQEGMFCPE